MTLELNKDAAGNYVFGTPAGLQELMLRELVTIEQLESYAKEIGLAWESQEALKQMSFSLWSLKEHKFLGALSQTPQAKMAEKLLGKRLEWKLYERPSLTGVFVELFNWPWANIDEPELSSSLEDERRSETEHADLSKLLGSIQHVLEGLDFPESDSFRSLVRDYLEHEAEMLEMKLKATEFKRLLSHERGKTAKFHAAKRGGKDYARSLDWKWRDISAFASILYFLVQSESPERRPRGRWGKGGDMLTYNTFLRSMAEGLVHNWKDKTHLERLKPRPEHISQIGCEPLKLEIRSEN